MAKTRVMDTHRNPSAGKMETRAHHGGPLGRTSNVLVGHVSVRMVRQIFELRVWWGAVVGNQNWGAIAWLMATIV